MIATSVFNPAKLIFELLENAEAGIFVANTLSGIWLDLNLHHRRVVLKSLTEEDILSLLTRLPKDEVTVCFSILKEMDAPSWVSGIKIMYLVHCELELSLSSI